MYATHEDSYTRNVDYYFRDKCPCFMFSTHCDTSDSMRIIHKFDKISLKTDENGHKIYKSFISFYHAYLVFIFKVKNCLNYNLKMLMNR